jgi:2-C-methyl-D-erythritol 4-phosphate cytidylyltransferase
MRFRRPKALVELGGKPILIRCLEAFRGVGGIREIVLALPRAHCARAVSRYGEHFRRLGVKKIVSGGPTRRRSVANALSVVRSESKWILVHDAARPLVTKGEIRAVLKAARGGGAAIAALPVSDTLKEVGRGGRIVRTHDRSGLWRALTPQVFRADLLRRAHARRGRGSATDDAQLVERLGQRVRVVEGLAGNIKITTRSDLRLAEALLKAR